MQRTLISRHSTASASRERRRVSDFELARFDRELNKPGGVVPIQAVLGAAWLVRICAPRGTKTGRPGPLQRRSFAQKKPLALYG